MESDEITISDSEVEIIENDNDVEELDKWITQQYEEYEEESTDAWIKNVPVQPFEAPKHANLFFLQSYPVSGNETNSQPNKDIRFKTKNEGEEKEKEEGEVDDNIEFVGTLIRNKDNSKVREIRRTVLNDHKRSRRKIEGTRSSAGNIFLQRSTNKPSLATAISDAIQDKRSLLNFEKLERKRRVKKPDVDVEDELELTSHSGIADFLQKPKRKSIIDQLKVKKSKPITNQSNNDELFDRKSPEMEIIPRTVASSLKKILEMTANTSEEKFKVLDTRDKLYKHLRDKDPSAKRGALVGTCPDMCPEKERYMREFQFQVSIFEMANYPKNTALDHNLAVKQYSRSSADQEEPLPHELRPVPVLTMTMGYLLHNVVDLCEFSDDNLEDWYMFMWDRTRALRKELTQQGIHNLETVTLVEQCARFHIHCAERLVDQDSSIYDDKINTENLTKCLQTLKYMYKDLANEDIYCPNEPEFVCYSLLLNLNNTSVFVELSDMSQRVMTSESVRFALDIMSAWETRNYIRFFNLVKQTTYLNGCILRRYFSEMRLYAIRTMIRSYCTKTYSPQMAICRFVENLNFEGESECMRFLEYCSFNFNEIDGLQTVNFDRMSFQNPETSFPPNRAYIFIEEKKKNPLSVLMAGGTLPPKTYEDHSLQDSFTASGELKRDSSLLIELVNLLDRNKQNDSKPDIVKSTGETSASPSTGIFAKVSNRDPRINKTTSNESSPIKNSIFSSGDDKPQSNSIFGGSSTPIFGEKRDAPKAPIFTLKQSSIFQNSSNAPSNTTSGGSTSVFTSGGSTPTGNIFGDPKPMIFPSAPKNLFQSDSKSITEFKFTATPSAAPLVTNNENQFSQKPIFNPPSTFPSAVNSPFTSNFQFKVPAFSEENEAKAREEEEKKKRLEMAQQELLRKIQEEEKRRQIEQENKRKEMLLAEQARKLQEEAERKRLQEEKERIERERIQKEKERIQKEKERREEEERQRQLELERQRRREEEERQRRLELERQERERQRLEELRKKEETERLAELRRLEEIKQREIAYRRKVESKLCSLKKKYELWKTKIWFDKWRIKTWNSIEEREMKKYSKDVKIRYPPVCSEELLNGNPYGLVIPSVLVLENFQTRKRKSTINEEEKILTPPEALPLIKIPEIVAKPLASRANRLYNKEVHLFPWKLVFSLPDDSESPELWRHIETCVEMHFVENYSWQFGKQKGPLYLKEHCQGAFRYAVSIRRLRGCDLYEGDEPNPSVSVGSNGLVFVMTDDRTKLLKASQRLTKVLRSRQPMPEIPVVIFVLGDKLTKENVREALGLDRWTESHVSEYEILTSAGFDGKELAARLSNCLSLVSNLSSPLSPLRMTTLSDFCFGDCLDAIWLRIETSLSDYKIILKEPKFVIEYYNSCIDGLIEVFLDSDYDDYTLTGEEFEKFFKSKSSMRRPNRNSNYKKTLTAALDSLKFPRWPKETPKTSHQLTYRIHQYCKKVAGEDKMKVKNVKWLLYQIIRRSLLWKGLDIYCNEDIDDILVQFPWTQVFQEISRVLLRQSNFKTDSGEEIVVIYNTERIEEFSFERSLVGKFLKNSRSKKQAPNFESSIEDSNPHLENDSIIFAYSAALEKESSKRKRNSSENDNLDGLFESPAGKRQVLEEEEIDRIDFSDLRNNFQSASDKLDQLKKQLQENERMLIEAQNMLT